MLFVFFFSSRRRHTRSKRDWSSDVCSSDLAYARVPTGSDTCAFCIMLASRGFVYSSSKAAGELSKFHGDCDCAIVAEDGVVPEGYDPDELYEKYQNAHVSGSTKETLSNLRSDLGTH